MADINIKESDLEPIDQGAVASPSATSANEAPRAALQAIPLEMLTQGPAGVNGLSPDTAMQESPLSWADRLKLSFGNEQGKIQYLKGKYKDAAKNADDEFVVQDQDGLWKRVDPSGLGDTDGWSMSQKIARKGEEFLADYTADIASDAISLIATGAGASVGNAPGAVAAAATASVANSSLGRWLGTYDATPQEQVADAALDGLLTAGGYMILPAGKLANKFVGEKGRALARTMGFETTAHAFEPVEGLKAVGRGLKGMSKEAGHALLRLTGQSPGSAEILINHTDEVIEQAVKPAIKMMNSGKSFLETTDKMVLFANKAMEEGVSSLDTLGGKYAKLSAQRSVEPAFEGVTLKTGILRPRDTETILGQMVRRNARGSLEMIPERELNPWVINELGSKGYGWVRKLLPDIERLESQGTVKGKGSARLLLGIEKRFSQILSNMKNGESKDAVRNIERIIMDPLKAQVEQQNAKALSAFNKHTTFTRQLFQNINSLKDRTLAGSLSTKAATLNQAENVLDVNAFRQAVTGMKGLIEQNAPLLNTDRFFKPAFDKMVRSQALMAGQEYLLKTPPKVIGKAIVGAAGTLGFFGGGPALGMAAMLPAAIATSPRGQIAAIQALRGRARFGEAVLDAADPMMQQFSGMAQYLQKVKPLVMGAPPQARAKLLEGSLNLITQSMSEENATLRSFVQGVARGQ